MNKTFGQILALLDKKDVKISEHGYDEIVGEDIYVKDLLAGIFEGPVFKRLLLFLRFHF